MGITLGKKRLKSGRISLFLDITSHGVRKKEYLGILLSGSRAGFCRKADHEKLMLAEEIRIKRELSFIRERYFMNDKAPFSRPVLFSDFMKQFCADYNKKDKKVMAACLQQYLNFIQLHGDLDITQITTRRCKEFLQFLNEHLHGSTPANYFKKFISCVRYLVEKGILRQDPTLHISLQYAIFRAKEALSVSDLQKLYVTPCKHAELKKAFLFCCNTGLRWCDVNKLQTENINFETKILDFVQSKVEGHSKSARLQVYLNENAMNLLSKNILGKNERLFHLPSYSYATRILIQWTQTAGINQHVTFHCARHTFITLLIDSGVSVKTVAALAGHSSTKHTERYIHAIDARLKEAVDKLSAFHSCEEE